MSTAGAVLRHGVYQSAAVELTKQPVSATDCSDKLHYCSSGLREAPIPIPLPMPQYC